MQEKEFNLCDRIDIVEARKIIEAVQRLRKAVLLIILRL